MNQFIACLGAWEGGSELFVGLASVVVASIVSLIVNVIMNKQNQRKTYTEIASNDRIAWIKAMREKGEALLAICDCYDTLDEKTNREFHELKNGILLRLNPKDSDYELDKKVQEILEDRTFPEIKARSAELREHLIRLFKGQWDTVKAEAGRDKRMKKKVQENEI